MNRNLLLFTVLAIANVVYPVYRFPILNHQIDFRQDGGRILDLNSIEAITRETFLELFRDVYKDKAMLVVRVNKGRNEQYYDYFSSAYNLDYFDADPITRKTIKSMDLYLLRRSETLDLECIYLGDELRVIPSLTDLIDPKNQKLDLKDFPKSLNVLLKFSSAMNCNFQDDTVIENLAEALSSGLLSHREEFFGNRKLAKCLISLDRDSEAVGPLMKVLSSAFWRKAYMNIPSGTRRQLNRCRFDLGMCLDRLNRDKEAVSYLKKALDEKIGLSREDMQLGQCRLEAIPTEDVEIKRKKRYNLRPHPNKRLKSYPSLRD